MFAAGATASSPDRDVADAMFLTNHPGWTWADLQATPARVLAAIRLIDEGRANGK